MILRIFLLLITMCLSFSYAQAEDDKNKHKAKTKPDDKDKYEERKAEVAKRETSYVGFSGISQAKADSLLGKLYAEKVALAAGGDMEDFIRLDSAYRAKESVMSLDSIYKERLDMVFSAVHLPYNHVVKNSIERYTKYPTGTGRMFGLSLYYFPIFERELAANGLPIELRVLPMIESSLRPTVMSYMGAGGLWQFTHSTGKHYGLRINSFIDERFDPVKATKAACRFLKDLYDIYNDWTLVLAAYNCGPGNVNKALAKVPDATNYWDIYYHLPTETRGYVPNFVGATYTYVFHEAHDIAFEMPSHPVVVDTLVVSGKLLHFKQITSTLDQVSLEMLRELNPMYRMDIVPALKEDFPLVLPLSAVSQYLEHEAEIDAKDKIYLSEYLGKANLDMNATGYVIHTVKSGEVLGVIARKHRVTVAKLMQWNNIKDARKVRAGQKLKIYL